MQPINELNVQEYCANMLKSLHNRGISAIPLQGKRPHFSIKWKQFQTTIPTDYQSDEWINRGFTSYGIICGQISQGILVIDFDSCDLYERFCDDFPRISDTYTVRTSRGFHVYLKTKFHVASRTFEKCDIKGDGGYVVGVGSIVNGSSYQKYRDSSILTITHKQYQQIIKWLSPKNKQLALPVSTPKTNFDVISDYLQRVSNICRNNALYATACEARRNGLSEKHVTKELLSVFVLTSSKTEYKRETTSQRINEGQRTIRSAYSGTQLNSLQGYISNSIREKLLQTQQSTLTARLLDAIKYVKVKSQWITSTELLQLAERVHISKSSLYRVLCGDLAKVNGKRILKRFEYNEHKHHIYTNVSQGDSRKPKSRRGRSIQFVYQIPTNYYLCNIMRIEDSVADKLQMQDLASASKYRRALHRELIRRLSPAVRVEWLAKRLGVHRRTVFRYNVQLQVKVTPMIQREKLTVELAQSLANGEVDGSHSFTPGMWLETRSGKRYPAIQPIANSLVDDKDCRAWICRQLPSKYTLEHDSHKNDYPIRLPDHLRSRATLLTYDNVRSVLAPDWATNKYDLGGYLAVYNGYEWTFRPPLRVVAYPLVKTYENGLVYYIRPLKS